MATITTAQTGNWSDTATWVGGVVPVAGDIAILNHSVTADVDIDGVELPSQASTQLIVDGTSRSLTNLIINGTINNSNGFIRINNTTLLNTVNLTASIAMTAGNNSRSLVRASAPLQFNTTINAVLSNMSGTTLFYFEGNQTEIVASGSIDGFGSGNMFYSNGTDIQLDWNGISSGSMLFCNAATNRYFSVLSVRGVSNLTNAVPFNTFLDGRVSGVHNNFSGQAFRPRTASDSLTINAGESVRFINKNTANDDVNLYTADLLTGYPLEADVEDGVTYGPVGEFTGTLDPVVIDTAQLASNLLNEMNSSNLTIAQGLRDGMGASAAAIAAVGSINVIP